jgi:hypothetical protein
MNSFLISWAYHFPSAPLFIDVFIIKILKKHAIFLNPLAKELSRGLTQENLGLPFCHAFKELIDLMSKNEMDGC